MIALGQEAAISSLRGAAALQIDAGVPMLAQLIALRLAVVAPSKQEAGSRVTEVPAPALYLALLSSPPVPDLASPHMGIELDAANRCRHHPGRHRGIIRGGIEASSGAASGHHPG